jgi:hypothetical protein
MNILFIGNSHTYYNELQAMFAELVKAGGSEEIYALRCTEPGVALSWHWDNAGSHDMIKERKWDYVVLQDRSGAPLEYPEESVKFATLFHNEIKEECGAKVVLYMTCAYLPGFEQQDLVTEHYQKLQSKLGCQMAPVGAAWKNAFAKIEGLRLHDDDNSHANPTGTYLAACVFYATVMGRSPVGLPAKVVSNGEMLADIPEELAGKLQSIAFETVSESRSAP